MDKSLRQAAEMAWKAEQAVRPYTAYNSWCRGYEAALRQALAEQDVVGYALEPDAVKIGLAIKESVTKAVAEEREACASLAEEMVTLRVAKAIRARGE